MQILNNLKYYILAKEELVNYCSTTELELIISTNKYKRYVTNLILKLLIKLKIVSRKEANITNITYETVNLNLNDLVSYIDDYAYLLENRYNTKPLLLVVGRDVYKQLTRLELNNPYAFDLNRFSVDKRFLGIKLYVCPYINGCFIIPDIKELR